MARALETRETVTTGKVGSLPELGRKHIKADGTEVTLDKPISIREVNELIGADTLDTVNLRDKHRHVMLVDDAFMDKGLAVNHKATALYWSVCRPGTTHQIRGDVVIVPDADFGGPF